VFASLDESPTRLDYFLDCLVEAGFVSETEPDVINAAFLPGASPRTPSTVDA
jgi:hypothetical protein